MKILHATDLHLCQSWFSYLAKRQDKFDAICISGDLLDGCANLSLKEQNSAISKWLEAIKIPLFICSGNHDNGMKFTQPNIYFDGQVICLNKVKFGCMPYLCDDYEPFKSCEILLTHIPPHRTPTATDKRGRDYGCERLFKAIHRGEIGARILLCGHIHEPKANVFKLKKTMIYNPGCDFKSVVPRVGEIEIQSIYYHSASCTKVYINRHF